jgi:hypothetical protein
VPETWGQTVLFSQNFSSSTNVTDYISGTPGTTRFTMINQDVAGNAGNSRSINTGRLRMVRAGGTPTIAYSAVFPSTPKVVRMSFDFSSSNPGNQTSSMAVYFGGAQGDNLNEENAHSRFHLENRNGSVFRVRVVDGGNATSGTFAYGSKVTWVINNSGATFTYTAPGGGTETLANDRADIFVGTTRVFDDRAIWNAGLDLNTFKIRFLQNATYDLDNFLIERLDFDLHTPIAPYGHFCVTPVTPSSSFSVPYSTTDLSAFNAGNQVRAELSDASGSFATPTVIGFTTTTANAGTVSAQIPANTPTGSGYRIRIVSTNPANISLTNNGSNIVVVLSGTAVSVTPGTAQVVEPSGTGAVLTASVAAVQWGYRTASGGAITNIPGATAATYTITGSHFPGKGEYFVVAQDVCGFAISNEVPYTVQCLSGTNLLTNGTFDAGNTGFTSEYNFVNPDGAVPSGSPAGTTMIPEGTYGVSFNPKSYHPNFCDFHGTPDPAGGISGMHIVGNAATNGSKKLWAQTIAADPAGDYVVIFDAASLAGAASSLNFGLYINCKQVGDLITGFTTNCGSRRFYYRFNASGNSSLEVSIRNISVVAAGNDISIDNIQMYACPGPGTFPQLETNLVWKGFTDDWFNPDNWGSCVLPNCNIDVRIPATVVSKYPVLKTGQTGTVRSIQIDAGSSLTQQGTALLNVCGDYTLQGTQSIEATCTTTFQGNKNPQLVQTNVLGTNSFGRVRINKSGAAQLLSLNGSIEAKGEFHLAQGTLVANDKAVYLHADSRFDANGTLLAGTGLFEFRGAANQTIANTGAPQFYNFRLNQSTTSQVIFQNNHIVINGTLDLTRGILNTSLPASLRVHVTNPAYSGMINYNAASFVACTLRKNINYTTGLVDFPVGNIARGYQLARVDFTAPTAITQFDSRFFSWGTVPNTDTPGTLLLNPNECSISGYNGPFMNNGYWVIDALDNPATGMYNIILFPTSVTNNTNAATVAKRPSGSTGTLGWDLPGTCNSNPPFNAVQRDGFSGFSQFAIPQSDQVFPVELLSLAARPENGNIRLEWLTAVEVGNAGFSIERLTPEGFQPIGWVEATANRAAVNAYRFLDTDVRPGTTYYYRLNQRDLNGQTTYSPVVEASLEAIESLAATLYPNPTAADASLRVELPEATTLTLEVLDVVGKTVWAHDHVLAAGTHVLTLPLADRPAGLYVVRLRDANTQLQPVYTGKVVKR